MPRLPAPPADAPAVYFRDLAVLADDVLMLDGASGRLELGEVLTVRGANGAGKTTLLRVIAGLLLPTAGEVHVRGRLPDDRDPGFRRSLAALIGPPMTARDLTVREHLQFIAATWGADVTAAQHTAAELLVELGITALASRYPHELSSGQTQLVSLALTLARPAEVLVLDEPEQRLDADRLGLVTAALQRRVAAGTALVLATHSDRLASELGGTVLTLEGEEVA
jgi:ABC-type multidrug transport system ATPase subunit